MAQSFIRWFAQSGIALIGADNEDDVDVDSDSTDVDTDDGSDGDADGDDDGGDDDADSAAESPEAKLKKERAKSRDLRARLRAALEEKEERDANDADDELAETKAELESMRKLLNGPYMQSKIDQFTDAKGNKRWDWEDTETVFALLDRSELEVDVRTGEIDGLEDQLEDLAARKPFLLKKAGGKSNPSGKPPGKPGNGSKKPSNESLGADFPFLASITS
jgi:hypothetical protein